MKHDSIVGLVAESIILDTLDSVSLDHGLCLLVLLELLARGHRRDNRLKLPHALLERHVRLVILARSIALERLKSGRSIRALIQQRPMVGAHALLTNVAITDALNGRIIEPDHYLHEPRGSIRCRPGGVAVASARKTNVSLLKLHRQNSSDFKQIMPRPARVKHGRLLGIEERVTLAANYGKSIVVYDSRRSATAAVGR